MKRTKKKKPKSTHKGRKKNLLTLKYSKHLWMEAKAEFVTIYGLIAPSFINLDCAHLMRPEQHGGVWMHPVHCLQCEA